MVLSKRTARSTILPGKVTFLLVSGLGPFRSYSEYLAGTPLGTDYPDSAELQQTYARLLGGPLDLKRLHYTRNGAAEPLLRQRSYREPCLSSMTMRSILEGEGIDYDAIEIEDLWYESAEPPRRHYDVVGLSTTFLCRGKHVRKVIRWIRDRFPEAKLVVGGQFSNLKYAMLLSEHPDVDYIIRGDAEAALPMLLRALDGRATLDDVPNLVARDEGGSPRMNRFEYIDIEAHPSPRFQGRHLSVPYESMRGCPFTCKYCSFPAASPTWRYKSAEKIVGDWKSYVEQNGAGLIAALDSTFTVPPVRLKRVLELLSQTRIPWYAFSRANNIKDRETVTQLEASSCRGLSIGFESMNDATLKAMDKKVTAGENRRAFDLLDQSEVLVNGSFMIGYPSETPEAYEVTHNFLVRELRGRFGLSVFSVVDETMPVWQEAAKYQLEETDDGWRHCGMDQATASKLQARTMLDVRWNNDDAVMLTWQFDYATPIAQGFGVRGNRRVEKLVDRLTFLVRDWGTGDEAERRGRAALSELESLGVRQLEPETSHHSG